MGMAIINGHRDRVGNIKQIRNKTKKSIEWYK